MEDMHIHLKAGVTDINIMRDYIKKCREMNLTRVLFLDHGNRMSVKHKPVLNDPKVIKNFFENIEIVKEESPDIDINVGIESDFSYDKEFRKKEEEILKKYKFDYIIGSVHGMDNADYENYLDAILDMEKTYTLDIIGHLKLRKEYENYKSKIEEIVKIAAQRKLMFDVNTSDRSRWNIQQLEYMMGLFKKYKVKYTIGSDAHNINEIGYHIKEEYIKIEKINNNEKRDIEYTVVSRGTEKNGSKGYIGISREFEGNRFLLLSKHFDKYIDTYKDSFKISTKYSLDNIIVSRFELMSAITLKPLLGILKDNILITGFGNIGFTVLQYLLDNNFKNISIEIERVKSFHIETIKRLNEKYSANIKIVKSIENYYNTYIEATGSSDIIKDIFENAECLSTIILIGVPVEEKYLINPLTINRKNLRVIGGHELNGYTIEQRKKILNELLESNKNKDFKKYINVYKPSDNIINEILNEKRNFIEVIKYDI